MRFLHVLVLLALGGAPAFARIGENLRAMEMRYGTPVRVSDKGDIATYRRGRLSVVVHVAGGVVDMVSYRKLPIATTPLTHEPAPPFTQEEIHTILLDNGGEWVTQEEGERHRVWIRADGLQSARWEGVTDSLTIYTSQFERAHVGV